MRDVVRHLAHRGHQPLQPVEGGVDAAGQAVELVPARARRQAAADVARLHRSQRRLHRGGAAGHAAAHQNPTQQAEQQRRAAHPARSAEQPRLEVARVEPGSVADKRGVQQGDVVVRAGDRDVGAPGDVAAAVDAARKAGRSNVALLVGRGGARLFVALPLTAAAG